MIIYNSLELAYDVESKRLVFVEKHSDSNRYVRMVSSPDKRHPNRIVVMRRDGRSFDEDGRTWSLLHFAPCEIALEGSRTTMYLKLPRGYFGVKVEEGWNLPTISNNTPVRFIVTCDDPTPSADDIRRRCEIADMIAVDLVTDAGKLSDTTKAESILRLDLHAGVKRNSVCIVTLCRNEGIYLPHWIAYHRSLGVDRFFIYTNDNDDSDQAIMDHLNQLTYVTVIDNTHEGSKVSPQKRAMTRAFVTECDEVRSYQWALVIDPDEYLSLDSDYGNDFKAFLEHFHHAEQIALSWRFMRPEKVLGEDDLLIAPPNRLPDVCHQQYIGDGYRIVKSVFKTQSVVCSDAHNPIWPKDKAHPIALLSNGEPHLHQHNPETSHLTNDALFSDTYCTVNARLYHYFARSPMEYFIKSLRSRAFGDFEKTASFERFNNPYWVRPVTGSMADIDNLCRLPDTALRYIGPTVYEWFEEEAPAFCIELNVLLKEGARAVLDKYRSAVESLTKLDPSEFNEDAHRFFELCGIIWDETPPKPETSPDLVALVRDTNLSANMSGIVTPGHYTSPGIKDDFDAIRATVPGDDFRSS